MYAVIRAQKISSLTINAIFFLELEVDKLCLFISFSVKSPVDYGQCNADIYYPAEHYLSVKYQIGKLFSPGLKYIKYDHYKKGYKHPEHCLRIGKKLSKFKVDEPCRPEVFKYHSDQACGLWQAPRTEKYPGDRDYEKGDKAPYPFIERIVGSYLKL